MISNVEEESKVVETCRQKGNGECEKQSSKNILKKSKH